MNKNEFKNFLVLTKIETFLRILIIIVILQRKKMFKILLNSLLHLKIFSNNKMYFMMKMIEFSFKLNYVNFKELIFKNH